MITVKEKKTLVWQELNYIVNNYIIVVKYYIVKENKEIIEKYYKHFKNDHTMLIIIVFMFF